MLARLRSLTADFATNRVSMVLIVVYAHLLFSPSRSDTPHGLMRTHDTADRIVLARLLVEHLLARRETRWPCYQTRLDYPLRNDLEYKVFINSRLEDGHISICKRDTEPPYTRAPLENT